MNKIEIKIAIIFLTIGIIVGMEIMYAGNLKLLKKYNIIVEKRTLVN